MKTDCKSVTKRILSILRFFSNPDTGPVVDNLDEDVKMHGDDKATFVISKYVDEKASEGEITPLGMIVYTVTVEAKFIPVSEFR